MTLSRSPQCRAFSKAVMNERSLSPLFPVGEGGGVSGYKWLVHLKCGFCDSHHSRERFPNEFHFIVSLIITFACKEKNQSKEK